jgi:antitoxin YefM
MLKFLPLTCTLWLYIYKEENMAIQTTYTHARARLAFLIDEVTKNREVVIIQRRGCEDVAMIAADELVGILETAHLLRSPTNAERLLTALDRVRKGSGTPQTIDELRSKVGFE